MPLAPTLIMLAIYGQVALTIGLLFVMGRRRIRALKEGHTTMDKIALNASAWPDDCLKAANAYRNQFEIPVLFYAVCLLFIGFSRPDLFVAILAIAFVITRYAHALIHINSNHVRKRAHIFFIGVICVTLMWAYLIFSHITVLIKLA